MDSRQLFEEFFDMMQDIGEHCGSSLGQWHHDLMLRAWEASRESLVIELPEVHRDVTFDDESIDLMWPDEVIEAIHAAGIRTK